MKTGFPRTPKAHTFALGNPGALMKSFASLTNEDGNSVA